MSVDYDKLAKQYESFRESDIRIANKISKHTKDAISVINVGAGMGAYEPTHCEVVSVEPSYEMIAKRKETMATNVQGFAEKLPFIDNYFDVAMAILTIHHWSDIPKGLAEMQRVAKRKVVLLTWVDDSPKFWLEDYFPKIREIDKRLFPTIKELNQILGPITVEIVEIPYDCTDGFMCAYWRRPYAYLCEDIRKAISAFARLTNVNEGLVRLQSDLYSGKWHKKYGKLLGLESLDLGYRLVACDRRIA